YKGRPNGRQRAWAQQWVKAGAAAIIGNHPHVLQTVEWMTKPSGDQAVVVYSLGNFVAAQGAFEKRLSAIAHLDFGVTSRGLVVEQFSYTPTIRPRGSIAHFRADSDKEARAAAERQLGPVRCAN
nr:CapA family protein [Pseudobdellovibrionaceae bacterium]